MMLTDSYYLYLTNVFVNNVKETYWILVLSVQNGKKRQTTSSNKMYLLWEMFFLWFEKNVYAFHNEMCFVNFVNALTIRNEWIVDFNVNIFL